VNDFALVWPKPTKPISNSFCKPSKARRLSRLLSPRWISGGLTIEHTESIVRGVGIGKKQRDNGVLLFVAPYDKTVRIEVGYGLEAILPDGLAGEIIRTEIIPEFSAGNIPRGIGRGSTESHKSCAGSDGCWAWGLVPRRGTIVGPS
jgi:hypothetical protein